MEAGIKLRDRSLSQYASVASVFRALIDLPGDVQAGTVTLHARNAGAVRGEV